MKNKSLSLIFYTLSQTPSHLNELSSALGLSENVVRNALWFLRNNKLIRELRIKRKFINGAVKEFYPLILQKRKKIIKGLPQKEAKEVLRNVKFYFISGKGIYFLPYAQKKIFGGEKNAKRNKKTSKKKQR